MYKTPVKCDTSLNTSLTPIRFPDSPKSKQVLTLRLEFDVLLKNWLDNYKKWQLAQDRGLSICRSIEAIKTRALENSNSTTFYPNGLKDYSDKLNSILNIFGDIVESTKLTLRRMTFLTAANQDLNEILYKTWKVNNFLLMGKTLLKRYMAELEIKKTVTEEICHGKTRAELITRTSQWQYPRHANDELKLLITFLKEELKDAL